MFLSPFFIFVRLQRFVLLLGCVFVLFVLVALLVHLVLLARAKSFRKKIIKGLKLPLITSFILLLNLSYYKHEFFNHYNLFQSLQSFSIIAVFFNYHNLFQLSQSFSIITIFFNHYNLLYYNLF